MLCGDRLRFAGTHQVDTLATELVLERLLGMVKKTMTTDARYELMRLKNAF